MLDAPFATFTSAGERFLPTFRVRALPTAVERDALLAAAIEAPGETVFQQVGDAPGLRARLLRLIKDLKQTGRDGPSIRRALLDTVDTMEPPARRRVRDFVRVFEAYEHQLAGAAFEDHEDVLRRLAGALRSARATSALAAPSPAPPWPTTLVFDGFDDFTPVEHTILEALVDLVTSREGQVVVTLPFDAARPELFAGSAPTRERLLRAGFVEHVLPDVSQRGAPVHLPRYADPSLSWLANSLFGPAPAAPLLGDAVRAIVAGDPDDEAECVARAIRALRTGWRHVGVVCRDVSVQGPRVVAALGRLGVPARLVGVGQSLADTPWLRAAKGPLDVLGGAVDAGAFSARHMRMWLRWCAVAKGNVAARRACDDLDIAQRRAPPPAKWDAFQEALPDSLVPWAQRLNAHREALDAASTTPERFQILGKALGALVPLPTGGGMDASGRPRDPARDARRSAAAAARGVVNGLVQGLCASAVRADAGQATDAPGAVQALQAAWRDVTVPRPDRRLDVVNVLDPETARYWEVDHVFVMGLAEGSFPTRPREDVLLRDAERDALAPHLSLPTARDREVRERRLFYGAVTRARRSVCLSRPAYDHNGNPLQPSAYWDTVHHGLEPARSYIAPGPGRLAWPLRWTFTRQDAVRLALTQREADPAFARELLRRAPDVLARARMHRRSDALTLDPATMGDDDIARLAESTAVLDVSTINRACACPHQHYIHGVLKLRGDELAYDASGFGVREEGQVLHRAFEQALRRPGASAEAIAEDCTAGLDLAPAARSALAVEVVRAVELLRDRQRKGAGSFAPLADGLEVAFGDHEPVWLGRGDRRFRLRGRVDRVDGDAAGRVVIVDYKRSKASTDRAHTASRGDEDLQLPLYARAIEEVRGVRAVGLEWVVCLQRNRRAVWAADAAPALSARAEGRAITEAPEVFRDRLDRAERAAAQTVAAVRRGELDRRPRTATTCKTCAARPLCRPDIRALFAPERSP